MCNLLQQGSFLSILHVSRWVAVSSPALPMKPGLSAFTKGGGPWTICHVLRVRPALATESKCRSRSMFNKIACRLRRSSAWERHVGAYLDLQCPPARGGGYDPGDQVEPKSRGQRDETGILVERHVHCIRRTLRSMVDFREPILNGNPDQKLPRMARLRVAGRGRPARLSARMTDMIKSRSFRKFQQR